MSSSHKLRDVVALAAAGVAAWATLVEPRLFTVRRHSLPVLPAPSESGKTANAGAPPLRVLQLSDLHLAPWQHQKIDWVRQLSLLKPDLLVLTGDQLGHPQAIPSLLYALAPFAGTPGVFVHGSNDYYGPRAKNPLKYLRAPSGQISRQPDLDTESLTWGLAQLGFIDLNNNATRITVRNTPLELFGLGDPHIDLDDATLMRSALHTLPAWRKHRPLLRLGVVHAPYQHALNALLDERAEVIFAGHTHGGQVRLPGVGALTSNCDLPNAQARGLSVWYDAEHAAYLNVSAGLGASIYAPVRFACRPEASLVILDTP